MNSHLMRAAAKRAAQIYHAQGFVPQNPGSFSVDGRFGHCAASALARAGLEILHGPQAADAFTADIQLVKSMEPVFLAFERLNWSRGACHFLLKRNKDAQPQNRVDDVLVAFEGLERGMVPDSCT